MPHPSHLPMRPPARRFSRYRLFISFLLLLLASALPADRVVLRNGRHLDGVIMSQNKNDITFRTSTGQIQSIQKSDILRMVYGNAGPDESAAEEKQRQEEAARLAEAKRQEAEKQEAVRRRLQQSREEEARHAKGAANESSKSKTGTSDKPGALSCGWRSAILPGWGQYACGETRSAIEAGVLFLGAGAYAAQQKAILKSDLKTYNRTSLHGFLALGQQGLYQTGIQIEFVRREKGQYRSSLRNYSQSVSILAFLYVAQIAHAFWIGHSSGGSTAFLQRGTTQTWMLSFPSEGLDSIDDRPSKNRALVLTFARRF